LHGLCLRAGKALREAMVQSRQRAGRAAVV